MGETFTKWARRNADKHAEGHMTLEEAKAEIAPLKETKTCGSVYVCEGWPSYERYFCVLAEGHGPIIVVDDCCVHESHGVEYWQHADLSTRTYWND